MKPLLETPADKRRRAIGIGLLGVALVLYGLWLMPGEGGYGYQSVDALPEAVYDWLREQDDDGDKFSAVNHDGRTYMVYDAGMVSNYKVEFKKIERLDENTVDVTMYAGPDREQGAIMDMGGTYLSRSIVLDEALDEGTVINLHFSDKDSRGKRLLSEMESHHDAATVGQTD